MLSTVTPCKPTKWHQPVTLSVNDFVVTPDFRPSQTYTAGNFATPRGSTAYEIKVNNEMSHTLKPTDTDNLRTQPQLRSHQAPWRILIKSLGMCRTQPLKGQLNNRQNRSKRTRKHPRRLRANPRHVQIIKAKMSRRKFPSVGEWSSRTKPDHLQTTTNTDKYLSLHKTNRPPSPSLNADNHCAQSIKPTTPRVFHWQTHQDFHLFTEHSLLQIK